MELIRVTRDKEKARSILKMASLIEERIKMQDKEKMAVLIITDYYEIIKELLTAVLLMDGYKTLSHKELVDYVKENSEFTEHEISNLNDLRVLRNRITYEEFLIEPSFLNRNEEFFKKIIQKLKKIIGKKLES